MASAGRRGHRIPLFPNLSFRNPREQQPEPLEVRPGPPAGLPLWPRAAGQLQQQGLCGGFCGGSKRQARGAGVQPSLHRAAGEAVSVLAVGPVGERGFGRKGTTRAFPGSVSCGRGALRAAHAGALGMLGRHAGRGASLSAPEAACSLIYPLRTGGRPSGPLPQGKGVQLPHSARISTKAPFY